jgi:hypothetical protein
MLKKNTTLISFIIVCLCVFVSSCHKQPDRFFCAPGSGMHGDKTHEEDSCGGSNGKSKNDNGCPQDPGDPGH